MAVQVVEQYDPFGRLGKGISQGLSEQLPKEIERQRLSAGLEGLKNLGPETSPFDLAAKAMSIPGMTPEKFSVLVPALQSYIARNEALGGGVGQNASGAIAPAPSQQVPVEGQQPRKMGQFEREYGFDPSTIETREDLARAKDMAPVLSPEEKRSRANQLMRDQPYNYPTLDKAFERVDRDEAQRIAVYNQGLASRERKLELEDAGRQEFDRQIKDVQIPWEMKERYERKLIQEINKGVPHREAANRLAQEIRDFAKAKTSMDALQSDWSIAPSDKLVKNLKSFRKSFEKVGELPQYAALLQSNHKMSPFLANQLAFPPSSGVQEEISSLKDYSTFGQKAISKLSKGITGREQDIANSSRQFAHKVIDKLSPEDSLFTVALGLNSKGYDEEAFREEIQAMLDSGELDEKLNERQLREIPNLQKATYSLGDVFSLNAMFGPADQISWWEKLNRSLGKK